MPADESPPPSDGSDELDEQVDFDEIRDVLDTAAHDVGHEDIASFVTDLLVETIEDPPEAPPEPSDETRYSFREAAFDGDYDEAAGRVTKAAAAVTPRKLGTLDFWGLSPSSSADPDALAVLTALPGVRHTDDELAGEIRATVETVAALADLYSTPVVEAVLTDVEGHKMVERRDGHYLWFWLSEDRFDRAMARLPSAVAAAVERDELRDVNESE
ncbi:hypothetical protein SAMN04487950_3061 [Halogranum rubrum]|uniref:Uncharacterized protein n=1 Tax=Halogranum rubrum TaxID=553466 RepID=A0A1I4G8A5_9EURY|nr:hypothetical protein [Halogranum rubrum]SFL25351.1 hypothetical protein SAMN04487950_3061 [Halogranum rubrum]